MALQKELSDIEEKIAYARQFYNRNVSDFNTRIQVVPNVFIAGMFGFQAFEFFEAEEGEREAPKVSFDKK
jgi:LemA protein